MIKPAEVFGRDYEWAALERFISDQQPGATLGVVSGRRRQGKTYLLEAVCEAAGGFYVGWFHWRPAMTFRPVGERRARPGAPRAVVAPKPCPERPRLRRARLSRAPGKTQSRLRLQARTSVSEPDLTVTGNPARSAADEVTR